MAKYDDAELATIEPPKVAPALPEALICEICGVEAIAVVVTWLGSADNSRMCGACYLSTATSIVLDIANAAPSE